MDRIEIEARLTFYKTLLVKLRAAYLALIDGGVQSYTIDDRSLTRFDVPKIMDEIKNAEKMVDQLTPLLQGGKRRKAFAILPRDW